MKKRQPLYVVNGVLASCVLAFALHLSKDGRGAVDWIVLSLIVLAILWNLFRLGQLLHGAGGGKALWHLQRTVLFWILGILSAVLRRPEDVGDWQHRLGWILLVAAAADTVWLFVKERRIVAAAETEP